MASSSATHHLLLLSLILGLFAIGANGRPGIHFHPCKTILISSFTVSSFKIKPLVDIPINPNSSATYDPNPSRVFSIFREIRDFYPRKPYRFQVYYDFDRRSFIESEPEFQFPRIRRSAIPSNSFGVSSLRDRTRDILSVVIAMLFGVGCGTLTAATMYLAWSLITNRYDSLGMEGDDDSDNDDVSPKKMGYVMIPTNAASASPVPAPAKEVV